PAAYTFFLAGLVLLLRGTDGAGSGLTLQSNPAAPGFAAAWGAALLFALALFVRPNLAPAAGILLAGAGIAALWQHNYRRAAGLVIGFLPVFAMALHNWIYGGRFVLFTATAAHPGALVMPPPAYLAALRDLLHFDLAGEQVPRALRQIGNWLAGPSELLIMAPLNAAAIAVPIRVLMWKQADPWLRLIAFATLAQQAVGIFYAPAGRY